MNNDITENYISFEVAKLLKGKGFDCYTRNAFQENGLGTWLDPSHYNGLGEPQGHKYWNRCNDRYAQCTHALAIKWIRENFGINITSNDDSGYRGVVQLLNKKENIWVNQFFYEKSEEAIEAALLYTLKNLI